MLKAGRDAGCTPLAARLHSPSREVPRGAATRGGVRLLPAQGSGGWRAGSGGHPLEELLGLFCEILAGELKVFSGHNFSK